jgi:GAF domain-containing protein
VFVRCKEHGEHHVTPPEHDPAAVAVQSAFDELGRISFAEHSLESVLHTVTELAGGVLPGQPVTSVTILRDRGPSTVASSGDLALQLDLVQYRLGDGPCVSAAATGRAAEILDTRAATRWPAFAGIAAQHGCDAVLSVPLPVQERLQGALNVYARQSAASSAGTRDLVTRFATYAAVPVSNMYLYESAVARAGHLQAALDSRAVIDQAKGILMERFKMTADQAFQALARVSMERNIKVREVASQFVETGELPDR